MEANNNRLIETLIRGRESTKRLQSLLNQKVNVDGSVSAEELLMEILGSFTSGISMLNSSVSGEIYEIPATTVENIPEVYAGKKPAPVVKDGRGCYKRRRTIDSHVTISATMEDGYVWRKYGQKEILNSKSPRCYFRCTHKNVHGCKALKQVQKLEDESNMYHITYLGHHTCPTFTNHEVVLDFQDFKNHYQVSINSPSTITNVHIDTSVKQEVVDSKDQSTDVSDNVSSANDDNSSQALRWNDVLRFGHEDSCASTSSQDLLFNVSFLGSDDLLSGWSASL
ncbi:WRKY DNA-binding transcription factor 70-like [Bidens hawaiensis]|uniref:WRKY DNA-binding transcription factor 70-like n=1 Tax=Bidens hawaiensis TaxID=980011 RepID=UPI00404A0A85